MGMIGSYVDDTISAGTPKFESQSRATERKFDSSTRVYGSITLAGIKVDKWEEEFVLNQARYYRSMDVLPECTEYEEFISLRHKLAWLCHTRPDLLAPANIMSQVTKERFEVKNIKLINRIIRRYKVKKERGLY